MIYSLNSGTKKVVNKVVDFDDGKTYVRDYHDTFSIQEMMVNEVMPKYFPDDTTKLKVGLLGMIGEYVGMTTEDAFNTASTYLMETFPTRARFESSIYTNASIFQLSNVFSKPSSCEFIMILNEEDVQRNFIQTQNGRFRYFYIDKDTIFYVNDIPFSLDYDIKLKAKYMGEVNGKKKYVYSASYDLSQYKNSVSGLNNPYVKVRVSSNGLIAISVRMHQYLRTTLIEDVMEDSSLSYPHVSIYHDGKVAGIDVLYKEPGDSDFKTQLELRPVFSQPSTEPFCFYRKVTDEQIMLTFTPRDGFFQPVLNSQLKVIIYTTLGKDGDFPAYTGTDVSITKNTENYHYAYSWALTGKPITASTNGMDAISMEDLRDLTVEAFSTAKALTTTHDLYLYFKNFHLHYGGNCKVLFLKKRDDAVERLHSAFLYVKKDDYFYPTNTLDLYTNIRKMDFNPIGYYHTSPGYLFTYKTEIVFYAPIKYHSILDYNNYYMGDNRGHYYYYENKRQVSPRLHISEKDMMDLVKLGDFEPGKVQWYKVDGINYKLYDEDGLIETDEASTLTEDEVLEMFLNKKLTFGRKNVEGEQIEFLTDETIEGKYRKEHLLYMETWKKNNNIEGDMTYSEYIFNYPYSQYEDDFDIDTRVSIFDGNTEEVVAGKDFVFTNPFLIQITKDTGLVGYYLSYINHSYTLDFVSQNDDDAFVQFITYNVHVNRNIGKDKKYNISLDLLPSVTLQSIDEMVDSRTFYNPESTSTNEEEGTLDQFLPRGLGYGTQVPSLQTYDKSLLEKNNLRVVLSFFDKDYGDMYGYMEMVPTKYDEASDHITFEAEFETDDFITSDNKFRVVHRCPNCGAKVTASANHNALNRDYYCMECKSFFKEGIINIKENDDILLAIMDAEIEVTVLYRSESEGPNYPTDNPFVQYDNTYMGYRWTNVYKTMSDPVTFIEPLNMIRGIVEYQDYYETGVDALDIVLYGIPMLKWSLITYKDEGMVVTNPLLSDDVGKFYTFMSDFKETYDYLAEAKMILCNATNIDVKFYNSYGRSNNFMIGENKEYIDTNNIHIAYHIWVVANTDILEAREELKDFIKEYIENINSEGSNDFYNSNLTKAIESSLPYVHHLKFIGINDYDSTYQSIRNTAISLEKLSKEERRNFVPEILTVNRNNIKLIIEEADNI